MWTPPGKGDQPCAKSSALTRTRHANIRRDRPCRRASAGPDESWDGRPPLTRGQEVFGVYGIVCLMARARESAWGGARPGSARCWARRDHRESRSLFLPAGKVFAGVTPPRPGEQAIEKVDKTNCQQAGSYQKWRMAATGGQPCSKSPAILKGGRR